MIERESRKLRIMIVLERGLELPSAMVAGLQYRELFKDRGYDATYCSLDEPPSAAASRGQYWLRRIRVPRMAERIEALRVQRHLDRIIQQAANCDLVFAIKIPSIGFYHRIRALERRPRILTCFADGMWLPFFRQGGWEYLEEILEASDAVTCESDYMADYARRYNQRIFIVHDSPQVEAFDSWRERVKRDPTKVVLGWVGSHATASSLFAIWEPLERLFAGHSNLHLRIVGGVPQFLPRFEKIDWSYMPSYDQTHMVKEVLAMDIGLYPLFDVEESLARGTLKAMVYMSGEAVAVCQDLGDSRNLIVDGVNGMLAGSHAEWFEKLEWLIEHPEERQAIARRGLQIIRERFSRERCFEQLVYAIESVCAPSSAAAITPAIHGTFSA